MPYSVVVADNIVKIFNDGLPNEVIAIEGVSFNINEGETIVFQGPSGSGKTTLLTVIGCMAKPSSGDLFVLGSRVSKWSEDFLTQFRRQHIGFIFQNFNLIGDLTAFQNIALPLVPTGIGTAELNHRVETWADKLSIKHRLRFKTGILSGGEMQRVAVARALIADPEIVIADEPTAHLDTRLSQSIMDIFTELKFLGKTIVIATHDPLVVRASIVDKVISFRDGHIVNETEKL
jgi:putative ABC transport system ATP-binding protein